MLLCTLAFTLFALPVGHGVGTVILEQVFHAPSRIASIRSIDEAVVIGAALSLSSSAFVLQLLSESGELPTKFGSATLGILLLQVCLTQHCLWMNSALLFMTSALSLYATLVQQAVPWPLVCAHAWACLLAKFQWTAQSTPPQSYTCVFACICGRFHAMSGPGLCMLTNGV